MELIFYLERMGYDGCGGFYFSRRKFYCIESMKKYDGYDVLRQMDGTMVIYAEEGEKVVWTGYVTDVAEVAAKLSGREDAMCQR